MDAKKGILKYKQLLGIAVAAVVLAIIFVPPQAQAFNVQASIPNAQGGHVTQAATGETLNVSINISPSEFIAVSNVTLIVDNTQPSVANATFASNGQFIAGKAGLVKDNTLTVTPVASQNGVVYGFGTVATGLSSSGNTFNFVGLTNSSIAGSHSVLGVSGPATITISTKLNTGLLSVGNHTLNVAVGSSAGGTANRYLVAPQLAFAVDANSQITTASVSSGANVQTTIAAPGGGGAITVHFDNATSSGSIAIEQKTAASLDNQTSSIFNVIGASAASFTVGGSTALTAGTIYEIDTSAITHTGFILVTIPYDPNTLPAGMTESNVKFYHWTGSAWEDVTVSVDTSAKTVTGKLTTLSPVVAGYTQSSSTSTSTTTTSVGGGGGGGGSVILNPSLPSDYFSTNPLAKLQIQNSSFKDLTGSTVLSAKPGQQVSINASFKNYQQTPQDYAMIIQVVDQNGFTTDIGWVTGTVNAGEIADSARSWTPETAGNYTIKIFVWDNVSTNPVPLSEITTKYFSASE